MGNAVTTVTLTATVNDDGAEVSGVTLAGAAIADTDFSDGITVPSLVVGGNVIVITVTAEDDATTQTYTVTVTRVAGNSAATGKPTISGAAQVGMTLTAGMADIMNADGLSGVSYSYRWIRVDGGTETPISGATSGAYVPTSADVGKKVKVEVTDDDGNDETLESDAYPASGTIIAAVVGSVSVKFGSSTYSATEGGSVTVTVQLSDTPSSQVTIPLTRRNRRGASNADYSGFLSRLTFGTSDTSKTFTLTVTDDSVDDDGESVEIGFGSLPSGVTTGSPSIATVSLPDNDMTIPTVTFGSSTYTAREGGSVATVAVDLSEAPTGSMTIQLTKTHLGGASSADYSGVPASVTFTAGQTRRTFTVTATDDSDDDDGERVRLGFDTLPSGYAQGTRPTATVNLQDNDTSLPIVTIQPASTTEGQDIVFTVSISRPISGFQNLYYETGSSSVPSGSKAATADKDYVTPHAASKVIQIGYGLTEVEIRFSTIDDDLVEGTEIFGIGLQGDSSAIYLGTPTWSSAPSGTTTTTDSGTWTRSGATPQPVHPSVPAARSQVG